MQTRFSEAKQLIQMQSVAQHRVSTRATECEYICIAPALTFLVNPHMQNSELYSKRLLDCY